jgi:glyoxylase-like metal-dependent hydrolase (beta-lactamase superfamily II)
MHIEGFFDPATRAVSYIALDKATGQCAIVDSVLDFDAGSGRTATVSADRLAERVTALGATVQWILETHVHADHVSAAHYLKLRLGGRTGIGKHIGELKRMCGKRFVGGIDLARGASQFDHLFADDEPFALGALRCRAMHTPGHTPVCTTYVVSDGTEVAAFVGDALLMPDVGTACCAFPDGSARTLYRSVNRILSLPAHARLYVGHDCQPNGRELRFVTTVDEERRMNIHVRDGVSEEQFVILRHGQDA